MNFYLDLQNYSEVITKSCMNFTSLQQIDLILFVCVQICTCERARVFVYVCKFVIIHMQIYDYYTFSKKSRIKF